MLASWWEGVWSAPIRWLDRPYWRAVGWLYLIVTVFPFAALWVVLEVVDAVRADA